jgi:type I site-specific restriction endonuclease
MPHRISEAKTCKEMKVPPLAGGIDPSTGSGHRPQLEDAGRYLRDHSIERYQSFKPFGFPANGLEIYFVDVGYAAKREVFRFFMQKNQDNLLDLRQHAKPLAFVHHKGH